MNDNETGRYNNYLGGAFYNMGQVSGGANKSEYRCTGVGLDASSFYL